MKSTSNSSSLSSFSTAFVFSVLPELSNSPGFGLCFVLSNSTSPPGALASQYFGIFTNATDSPVAPLLAIEFDTGLNPEFNDPDENHIGIDLNNVISAQTAPAEYFNSSTGSFVPVNMRTGQNVHAWIDFDGVNFEINVTVAPVGVPKPSRPTLNYKGPVIANYVSSEMFVGFSASKTQWVEAQRILAWSFSDTGVLREINTTGLPIFFIESSSSSLSSGAIAGIVIGCVAFVIICGSGCYLIWRKKFREESEDEIEDWELEYLYAEGRLREAADARIREEYEGEEVEMVLKLGLACCHPDTSRRPTMKEVAAVLLGEEVAAAPAELLNDLTRGGSTAADDGHGGGAA
ncbi:hypothetical protein QUC31_007037 [Theobroma cacao]